MSKNERTFDLPLQSGPLMPLSIRERAGGSLRCPMISPDPYGWREGGSEVDISRAGEVLRGRDGGDGRRDGSSGGRTCGGIGCGTDGGSCSRASTLPDCFRSWRKL